MNIPSNWDISRPSESHAGKSSWWPENKDIMIEVTNNATMIQHLLHEIQGLKDTLLNSQKDEKRATSSPSSPKKKT
jgi:hypothetical protein